MERGRGGGIRMGGGCGFDGGMVRSGGGMVAVGVVWWGGGVVGWVGLGGMWYDIDMWGWWEVWLGVVCDGWGVGV